MVGFISVQLCFLVPLEFWILRYISDKLFEFVFLPCKFYAEVLVPISCFHNFVSCTHCKSQEALQRDTYDISDLDIEAMG